MLIAGHVSSTPSKLNHDKLLCPYNLHPYLPKLLDHIDCVFIIRIFNLFFQSGIPPATRVMLELRLFYKGSKADAFNYHSKSLTTC